MVDWLNSNKEALAALASLMTIGAILAGVIWFAWRRMRYPRATVEQKINHYHLDNGQILLRNAITVSNTGNVLLSIRRVIVRVQQILPIEGKVQDCINTALAKKHQEVSWPEIDSKESRWNKNEFEIEPGEIDHLEFDFILGTEINLIQVYCHVKNQKKWTRDIGWPRTRIYSLTDN